MKLTEPQSMEPTIHTELTERRYVYNGGSVPPVSDNVQRGNRPVKRRKRSPFNIVIVLFAVSILIVFYVWNKITVNRLVIEVNEQQLQYQKILYTNELMRADINKKSNLERISKIATGQLGLTYPKEQPIWFRADLDHLPADQR